MMAMLRLPPVAGRVKTSQEWPSDCLRKCMWFFMGGSLTFMEHSLFLPESKIGFQACQGALDT